ncbi:uncharacterized protein B0I36DRAFT_335573 [Microdochium trichocladiopsis]|uniref:Uncharacterized protein n=1 Tax=Microdochium trichocladiopsis TaxID=1682393 RepID=A0A9P8XVS7_9PEZI|nr:uncharacterized protein B0I36DRAFT_335573 [Microdochium trichocladiopsis]KAH7018246.1 hypothetical protein B0I36DRAFT_335573 [Microdochium trichocladiopsis]
MDGGSYNNVVRTSSPFSASSPTSNPNAYKANVNRTKTRKWVEARVQNYDGDDWGGDDYDDEDEPEEPMPAPLQKAPTGGLPSTLRAVSQPLQARSTDATDLYGRRSFGEPGTNLSNPHNGANFAAPSSQHQLPASLPHEQPTYTMSTPPGAQPFSPPAAPSYAAEPQQDPSMMNATFPPRKSSMSGAGGVPQGPYDPQNGFQPGYGTSTRQHEGLPTQESPAPPAANKPRFVRPSDIYKRMSQEKERERLSMESNRPSLDGITGRGNGATSPEASRTSGEQRRKASLDRDEPADYTLHGDRTALPTVAERDQSADISPIKTSTFDTGPSLQAKGPESTSPLLPEVSRMSMFGDDFFSSSIKDLSPPKQTNIAPIAESDERQPREPIAAGAKTTQTSGADSAADAGLGTAAAKKTAHGHLARPSLPGGWVSETPTPLETPAESLPVTDMRLPAPATSRGVASSAAERNDAPANVMATAPGADAAAASDSGEKWEPPSNGPPTKLEQHPTPHSLPPLKTQDPLKGTTDSIREGPGAESATSNIAPSSSVYQDSPQVMSHPQSSSETPVYSRQENLPPTFAPPLGAPRKSTLSSVTTASPLKESDVLREEIIKSLSPAVDSPTHEARLGPPTPSSPNAPDMPHESRSLSGIYDDYYGFQEDKALQETSRYLKSDAEPQQGPAPSAATQANANLPEIRPLSPNKQGLNPQVSTEHRERRFSFDAGPEHVTLSPVEAPTSTAVSFGSMSDRQPSRPEYQAADRTETSNGPPPRETTSGPESTNTQLHAPSQTITHQVSQMSIGANNDGDVNMIDQPSPLSAGKSETPRGATPGPIEDKVLVLPDSTADDSTAPEVVSDQILASDKAEVLPETADAPAPAGNTSGKIMPFREILSIGLPQHRIQKFDETRVQFFNMDTGLGDWLRHMHAQGDGTNTDGPRGGNDLASPTTAPASQQPYYQQYLNASNPNLSMPPPGRTNTGNVAGQSPNMSQGQQAQFGSSGFNTGGQVGTKGKELLQAAGVLGNKGVKTGMKFFNKSKTKLRERGFN